MATISLTRGMVAVVDDEDFEYLSRNPWFAMKSNGGWYASRWVRHGSGKRTILRMHVAIASRIGVASERFVDHVDGDTLNNRRENLRAATTKQNAWNRGVRRSNECGYVGVSRHGKGWRVQITDPDGYRIRLCRFATAEAAAKVYNIFAMLFHGNFAKLNEVPNARFASS